MNIGTPVLIIVVLFVVFTEFVFILYAESEGSSNFNKTFNALKSNDDLILSKTPMNQSEKERFLDNSCEIVFSSGAYRSMDVNLCKEQMRLGK